MDQDLITFSFPGLDTVRCAFSTRQGGVSTGPYSSCNISFDVGDREERVRINRGRIQGALGFTFWNELHQVHGTRVVCDPPTCSSHTLPGDSMTTSKPGQALAIKTADCQAILLAHASGRYICAMHCGWRGNRESFPILAVNTFCDRYRLKPSDLHAVRGPSLGPANAQFVNFDREWGPEFNDYFDRKSQTMDLWALTHDQLLSSGLRDENMYTIDLCTFEHPSRFFSYRREKTCGRQAGFIWMV